MFVLAPQEQSCSLKWRKADVAQLVAHHLAKVRVASSSLVIRSGTILVPEAVSPRWNGRVVRQRSAKPCTRVRFPFPPQNASAFSSAGERFPDTEEVTGSIPVSRTRVVSALFFQIHADVAQLVAHHLAKVRVASSSLVIRSKFFMGFARV